MKIAILFHWNYGMESGVYKKILCQVKFWRLFGHEVGIFQISRENSEVAECGYNSWKIFRYFPSSWMNRLYAWKSAVQAILKWQPDIVYHRFDLYYPALVELARKAPLVLEINTNDLKEYCLRPDFRCIYNHFTRGLLLREAAGMVFVSSELSKMPHFMRYRKPFIVIGNGIELEDYNPLPPTGNNVPHIVFIGSDGQPWHGVDKILSLAELKPDWMFEIIGFNSNETNKVNVTFHGVLFRREYERILARADIAVGTLALHRKKMNEASSLKVREYLAYGLPTIIGYKDTDFPEPVPFILELPNSEQNVVGGIKAIEAFVKKWRGKRVPREAVLRLDAGYKEQIRLSFFLKVLEQYKKQRFS